MLNLRFFVPELFLIRARFWPQLSCSDKNNSFLSFQTFNNELKNCWVRENKMELMAAGFEPLTSRLRDRHADRFVDFEPN